MVVKATEKNVRVDDLVYAESVPGPWASPEHCVWAGPGRGGLMAGVIGV